MASLFVMQTRQSAELMGSIALSHCHYLLESEPSDSDYGSSARASVFYKGQCVAQVRLRADELPDRGCTLRGIGRFKAYGTDDEWQQSARAQGICGEVRLSRILSIEAPHGLAGIMYQLRRSVLDVIKPELSCERALCAGLSLGSRRELRLKEIDQDMAELGLAHLIAVSGSHLALLSELIQRLLEKSHVKLTTRSLVVGAALFMYVCLCGFPLSAVRAWIMCCSTLLGQVLGRRGHGLSTLSIIVLVMCCVDMSCATNVGFLLSLLSVGAISLLNPYVRYVGQLLWSGSPRVRSSYLGVPAFVKRIISGLVSPMSVSLVCQFATFIVVAEQFGRISVVGVFANMLVSFPFSLCAALCLVFDVLCFIPCVGPLLAGIFIHVCSLAAGVFFGICELILKLPICSVALSQPHWSMS
ncbi:MAG: ComEC/Rec2 family competence protein, partial [Atopobiaceae bacterium]|nr:ComEC/Rec2 family competence protein [Atopobiaceae bacterium]